MPEGCEGWEDLYPYYAFFSEERRASEEARGWFRDGMHFPEPVFPFDFVTADSPYLCLGQANSRIFAVPPALGIDHRVLYGWIYMSANGVADEAEIGRRAELFTERAGFYFSHWDELYDRWQVKVEQTISELDALEVPELPDIEDAAVVTEGRGIGSSHTLLVAYHRLLESVDRIWQYHFELLNLGYAAYLVFYEFCKQSFPDIRDQTVAQDGLGHRRRLLPARRRAQAPRGARDRPRARGRGQEGPPARRPTLAGAPSGRHWLGDSTTRRRRGSGTPPAPATTTSTARGSTTRRCPSTRCAATSRGSRPARTSSARSARSSRSATASPPSTGRCCPTRRRRRRSTRPRPRAHGLPLRREPQLLRRALAPLDLLEQGARARGAARAARLPRDAEDIFYLHRYEVSDALSTSRRAGRSARRRAVRATGRRWSPRARRSWRRSGVVAAAGARDGAGGDHRAVHDHALGDHHRSGCREWAGAGGDDDGAIAQRLRPPRPASSRGSRA